MCLVLVFWLIPSLVVMASSTGSSSTDLPLKALTLPASLTEVVIRWKGRGSEDVPCRAFHSLTHPRDGHAASDCALGSNEFPPKRLGTEITGVDAMGPWVRLQPDDQLFLHHRMVHMAASCPLLSTNPPKLTACYCVDRLHRWFHYDVDDKY